MAPEAFGEVELMRVAAIAMGLFVLLCFSARGEDVVCRWYMGGKHFTEWVEQGEQRGARIVARDPKWELSGLGWHATSQAGCQTCSDDQIAGATLWFGTGDFFVSQKGEFERALSPEAVARMMAPFPFQVSGADFRAKTAIVPASLGELEGRARVISIKSDDGRSHEVIALFVGKGCLSLFGILYIKGGAEVALDSLNAFVQAIGVESYKPIPDPRFLNPPPPPEDTFPLGDAFRRRYIEKP